MKMKALISILVLFASHSVFACLDYSGEYQAATEDGAHLVLQAHQVKCESLLLKYNYSDGTAFEKNMIFDGIPRVIFDEPEFRTVETFLIGDEQIDFSADLYNLQASTLHKVKGTLTLDSDGNMIENKTIFDSQGLPLFGVDTVFFLNKDR